MLPQKTFHEVDIEINHACNRTCWYCPNDKKSRIEKGEMPQEIYQEIIKQLKEIDYRGKIFFHFYNEPLLCSQLDYYVDYCRTHLPFSKMELVTNGTLLTIERFQKLLKLGIDYFTITKHHGVIELPIEKFFNQLSEGEKEKVKIRNHDQLFLSNRAGSVPQISENKTLPLNRPCFIPSCMMVITNKGNVLVCYEDYDQISITGNMMEKNLMDIWNSTSYTEFRNDLKKGLREKYKLCSQCDNVKLIQ